MMVIQKSDVNNKTLNDFLESKKELENRIRENPEIFNEELNEELKEIYQRLHSIKKQNPELDLKSEINKLLDNPNYIGVIGCFIHNKKAIFYVKYGDNIYIPHYNVIFLALMFLEYNIGIDYIQLSIAKEQRGTLYIRVISPELRRKNFYYLLNGKYNVDDKGYLMNRPREKVEKFLRTDIISNSYTPYKISESISISTKNKNTDTIPKEIKEKMDKILENKKQIILYGVPGTGKTYLANKYIKEKTNNDKKKYEFTTFHQSYSYEDFIEGYRPKNDENGSIIYEVEDGIFKKMCILAIWEVLRNKENDGNIISNIDFNTLIEKFKEKYPIGSKLKTKNGKYFEISNYGSNTIDIKPLNGEQEYTLSIKKLEEFYNDQDVTRPSDIKYPNPTYYYSISKELRHIDNELKNNIKNENLTYEEIKQKVIHAIKNEKLTKEDFNDKPKYYLIIDEINRGNISNILGELITLLEKDKRLGEENEIITTLPYSKEPFAVPPNLYIIGTMNTADRSIALLDIALRRRFGFMEIEPDYEMLKEECSFKEVDLAKLLKSLNKKIAESIDKDHRIGHSYFLKVENTEDLKFVWYYEIIPLLEEYFYGDFEGLKKVIGDFIKDDEINKGLDGDEFITALNGIIENS